MESTGSYWKGLFVILQDYGLNPILVNGSQVKNVKGRKSDVQDAQWIQRLHSLGLLNGSFIPDNLTDSLKQYSRHRQKLQNNGADYIKKMQKAMRLMNIRLDNVLSDVVGKSGQTIIEAIIAGERNADILADKMDYRVRKSREEIIKALSGDWRDSYVFELKQSYELYRFLRKQIAECDQAIEQILRKVVENLPKEQQKEVHNFEPVKKKRVNKNAPKFAIEKLAFAVFGTDLSAIDGVSRSTLLALVCELGDNFEQFRSSSAFASWAGLCPNNKISGGKVLSKHTPKRSNAVANALKKAANVIGNLKQGALNQFFKRVAFKKGRVHAITATARKLAVIIWNMVTKKEAFNYMSDDAYASKVRQHKLKHIKRQMKLHDIAVEEIIDL